MLDIKVKRLPHFDPELAPPSYQTTLAAGADIRACFPNKDKLSIEPGQRVLVPTGLSFEIPPGYEIQVRPRSGLSLKTPLLVVNSPGTVDADYRGEVKIIIGNFGDKPYEIEHGERLAQLVVAPVYQVNFVEVANLTETERGELGFGSTGLQ
jgi:dUTP pyrophosphatase